MKKAFRRLKTAIFCCFFAQIPCFGQPSGDFFRFFKTDLPDREGLILLLPGSSGLEIFGDTSHYSSAAKKLNRRGFDAILIDYKRAFRTSKNRPKKASAGQKILWATDRALVWADSAGLRRAGEKCQIVAWSLGGEGVLAIAGDSVFLKKWAVAGAALFYPANRDAAVLKSCELPVLVQSGRADGVTTARSVEKTWAKCAGAGLIFYENAQHGFDVASLEKGKTVRFPPLFGKKYRFQFDPTATAAAEKRLFDFLLR